MHFGFINIGSNMHRFSSTAIYLLLIIFNRNTLLVILKFCYEIKKISTDQFETMKCRGKWSWLWSLVKVAMVYKPWGQGPQTGPSLVSLHSTFGKHGGGSSEHSGLLMRQALHSCKAFLSSIVSCFWILTSALSFLNASIWKKKLSRKKIKKKMRFYTSSCRVAIKTLSASSKLKIGMSPLL